MSNTYDFASGKHLATYVLDDLSFLEEEGKSPISQIYREAAGHLNIDYDSATGEFDSREILVSKNIADRALELMRNDGERNSAGMLWVCYGPKMDDSLKDNTIVISDRFYRESCLA